MKSTKRISLVEQAKAQARAIIEHIDPEHIESFDQLVAVLEADLETVKDERRRWRSVKSRQ